MKFRFENIRNLFQNQRLKAAFAAVKTDMDVLDEKNEALKGSVNEWVVFLDQENRALKQRVRDLEKKLDSFEDHIDERELSVLRSM